MEEDTKSRVAEIVSSMEMEISEAKERLAIVTSSHSPETVKSDEDFELARKNLKSLIDKGAKSFEELVQFAKETGHPRAYEVLGKMLETLTDANTKLLELHQIQNENTKGKYTGGKNVTNNNAIFVGTPNDLNEVIKKITGDKR